MKTPRRRPYGSGTVEAFRGMYRARLPRDENGARPILDTVASEEEAHRLLDAFHVAAAQDGVDLVGELTVAKYGEKWLDRRELEGVANIATDRSRWKHHIAKAPFAGWPLARVDRSHVRDWALSLMKKRAADEKEKRAISFQTRKHVVNLLRGLFNAAIEDGHVSENPCAKLKLRNPGETEEAWTFLTLDEQRAIAASKKIEEADRLRILFAIYTGLRQGEQWNLELRDLRHEDPLPHVFVRKGSKKGATKARRMRRVALVPAAVEVVKRWLVLLRRYAPKNPLGLVFPTPRGARRQRGKLYGFKEQLVDAGVSRPVRWHDLRHTCGSSLVAGWWGKSWSLQLVRDHLGHASITQTERYAHLAASELSRAASETLGHQMAITQQAAKQKTAEKKRRARQESNLRPTAPEFELLANDLQALGAVDGQLVAKSARVIRAVSSRNRFARRYAEELARAVTDLAVVGLARGVLEGGPLAYSRALRLAELILTAAPARVDAAEGVAV